MTLLKLIRWDEWFDSKIPLFFLAYYYLLLVYSKVELQDLLLLLPLGVFFVSLTSFGYMLNDYFDKSIDEVSGKANALSRLSKRQQILALATALLTSLIAFIPFYRYKFAVVFLFFSYLSSIVYSDHPFRFKEKGIVGLISASLAQRTLPLLIVFGIFERFGLDTFLFALLSFLIGLRWILVHQVIDYNRDIQANVKTFVVSMAPLRIYSIMRFLFAIELILLIDLIGVMAQYISFKILPIVAVYFIHELIFFPLWKKLSFRRMLISYDFAPLADFYFFWLPLWMSILLGCLNPRFFLITVIEVLWKIRYVKFDFGLIRLMRQYRKHP